MLLSVPSSNIYFWVKREATRRLNGCVFFWASIFFGGHQANIGDTRTILHEKVSLIPLPRIFFVRKNAIWAADRWAWNCFFLTILHWGDAKKLGSFDFILYSHFRWHLVQSKVFETRLFSIKNCPKVDFRSPSNKPNFEPHPLFFLSSLPRAGWLIWYRTITLYTVYELRIKFVVRKNKTKSIWFCVERWSEICRFTQPYSIFYITKMVVMVAQHKLWESAWYNYKRTSTWKFVFLNLNFKAVNELYYKTCF